MLCDYCHRPIEDGKDYQKSVLVTLATWYAIVYKEVKVGHYHCICLTVINSGRAA